MAIKFRVSNVPEDDVEGGYFVVISTDYLLAYENKNCLQACLDNCVYKIANNQTTDYLDDNLFETD